MGGLVIASRIAAATTPNAQVTILEKNGDVGGRCGSFDVSVQQQDDNIKGIFRHERGPSLLLLPHVYRQVFEDCAGSGSTRASTSSTTMEDFGLEIKPCVPAYKVVFDDGDSLDVGFPTAATREDSDTIVSALEQQSRATMDRFEPDGAAKWDAYLRTCQAFLDAGLPNFIEERLDLTTLPAFLREALRDSASAWPLKPHSDVLDALFESDKMKALASFQDLYVGLEPYRNNQRLGGGVLDTTAPAVFGLLAAIELHPANDKCGVFAPVGGFRAVTDSLAKLAQSLGVRVECGKTVVRVANDGVHYCCCANSNSSDSHNNPTDREGDAERLFEPADLVIVNADLPYATKSLIDQNSSNSDKPTAREAPMTERYDWDDKYRFSCGVIAFHWSLSRSLDDLSTHNVFLSASNRQDAEQSWSVLRDGTSVSKLPFASPEDPFNFYVHRASHTDPSAAPAGMDSILVLVPCPALQRDPDCANLPRHQVLHKYRQQFDSAYIDRAREAVLHRLAAVPSLRDVRSQILHEVVDTPATYADQYNVGAGTPFALSHGLAQLSVMRPAPLSSGLSNVLFCGASTRPGNGVPLVMIGAKLIAEKAVTKLKDRVIK